LGADEIGIDVDLAHVVDDDGDALALAVAEHVVQQRRLSGPEEAGEDGDREAGIGGQDEILVEAFIGIGPMR
jgi:hypothetical protein